MATVLQIEQIGVNPNAPAGYDAINLYAYNDATELTLGQMVMAICIHRASLIESSSVLKMNEVNRSATYVDALAYVGEKIMTRTTLDAQVDLTSTGYQPVNVGVKTTIGEFLTKEVGISSDQLPSDLRTVNNKTACYKLIENPLSQATTTNQEALIDLQSLLSRRDSTYNTSASTIKKLGQTMNSMANSI